MENQSEVDVNVLIKIYHSKLANLTNQNVLLEAKLATLSADYNNLLAENAELKQELEETPE